MLLNASGVSLLQPKKYFACGALEGVKNNLVTITRYWNTNKNRQSVSAGQIFIGRTERDCDAATVAKRGHVFCGGGTDGDHMYGGVMLKL